MGSRVLTAVVGIPVVLSLAFWGGWYWLAAILFLHLLAVAEVEKITRNLGWKVPAAALYGAALLFELASYLAGERGYLLAGLAALALMITFFLVSYPRYALGDFAAGFSLSVYLSLFSFLVLLNTTFGWRYLFATLFIAWANDTAAYYLGTFLGRHRLAPALSPKKTWEGAAAGLAAAGIVGVFIARWLAQSWQFWLAVALLAAAAGQAGDLWESALKRQAKIKDSGQLLPGHGGILDRFDSLLFIAPLVFYLNRWLG